MKTMIGNSIAVAAGYLKAGEVVGIPTETVYGLAGNALCERAVRLIFEVKQRPYQDPLIVHCADQDAVMSLVAAWPQAADVLAGAFWPGALTLLLPKQDMVPHLVTAGRSRVAVRVPSHPMMQRLLQQLPFPLAAPSANPFGYISPTTAMHVADQLGDVLPYILDGGPAALGLESTIVGFDDNEVVVYRLGSLPVEAIEKVLGTSVRFYKKKTSSGRLHAPGTSLQHYAPRTPLVVGEVYPLLQVHKDKRLGLISFQHQVVTPTGVEQVVLSPTGDLAVAAQRLFAVLRHLDHQGCDLIIAPRFPDVGLGQAMNDRLARASFCE